MSLLAGISQPSQLKVILHAVYPRLNDLVIHLSLICR